MPLMKVKNTLYLAQRCNSLKSTLFHTSCNMWMGITKIFYLGAVEFNLIQWISLKITWKHKSVLLFQKKK